MIKLFINKSVLLLWIQNIKKNYLLLKFLFCVYIAVTQQKIHIATKFFI